ncbi:MULTISPECIES: hypothetical protein [Moorena]|uniref:Uncharacterized protein n=1 Tax=Moorena producens 3L TaxID=489825 RepID=F4XXJ3_9CYAN|nr:MULTISPECIES: hypothetical protein [Moorena]EGJ30671.1 hypothetical protein LYNGBM3L_48120 [Moorena producens 3L]NEP30903.1 hypothetical protein [Moorena sp. SIO3B2]NEP64610.1 hypothetical protein [Moorena sp. SIO3A5]NER87710.1 hypothetical protein [Moorena sp. SIO3A2]OLT67856.1 hypothetical protein BI334_25000 [Moorena producens 3L]
MLKINRLWNKIVNKITSNSKFLLLTALSISLVLTFFRAPSLAQLPPLKQLPIEEDSETQPAPEIGIEEDSETQPAPEIGIEEGSEIQPAPEIGIEEGSETQSAPEIGIEEGSEIQPAPEIGWEFLGSRELNQVEIHETKYKGECPGYSWSSREARFTSSTTPPARKRRVIVKNITRGVASDPFPYTDREYDEGRSSEGTRMSFGTRHDSKEFHVLDGENTFEYEIKERDRVLESGVFTAVIKRNVDVRQRDSYPITKSVCMNSEVPMSLCADIRTLTKYKCRSNWVLRSFLMPNTPEVATLISNQTPYSVKYWINDRIQKLSSGSDKIYTNNFLNIKFESCSVGTEDGSKAKECTIKTRSLERGKRYRFTASDLDYESLDIEDFPRS